MYHFFKPSRILLDQFWKSSKFWFDTHKTGIILDKPETVEKHEMIKKTIQENPEMERKLQAILDAFSDE
ncbi:hypothetical protein SOVF_092760 isoform B [Spinacia oleracea]|nr:hypothetical protein SOVF_092760 isoform B [Spinacia oleracea]